MTEKFRFEQLEVEIPEVDDLGNAEKEILRGLAEPGGPLWKIMRRMTSYGEELKQSLITVDLDDPDQVRAVRKVQATIIAIAWVHSTFEQALQTVPTERKGEEDE